jgi:hypothetical protein
MAMWTKWNSRMLLMFVVLEFGVEAQRQTLSTGGKAVACLCRDSSQPLVSTRTPPHTTFAPLKASGSNYRLAMSHQHHPSCDLEVFCAGRLTVYAVGQFGSRDS